MAPFGRDGEQPAKARIALNATTMIIAFKMSFLTTLMLMASPTKSTALAVCDWTVALLAEIG
jgi:hypothetical protein